MTGAPGPQARRCGNLWLQPHRPFLLAAALWAVLAVLWWQWGARVGLAPPVLGTAGFWHAHEMIPGMAGAAAAGYLLTALASWTGGAPPSGRLLQALVALWLLQRLAMACAGVLPVWLATLPGLGFFGLFAGVLAAGVLRVGAWRKLGFAAAIAALGIGDAMLILAALGGAPLPDPARLLRGGVMLFAALISVIGGRMVPAFTDNRLQQGGAALRCRATPVADRVAPSVVALAGALAMVQPGPGAGLALVAAGLAEAWRVTGWRGWQVRDNPLLVMLQAGYAWLPAGLVLLGLSQLWPLHLPGVDALHALTMGAMGSMILAIAARAAARREAGALRAGRLIVTAGACLWPAVWLRLAVLPWPEAAPWLNGAAAALWVAGWAAFLAAFVPTLFGPVLRPVFSGARAGMSQSNGNI
ncbi:MAG: NnrS family protein [Rubellimicrobium sp.]|nr:NnrS family protein [Rubellimicrobium sp.]